MKTLRNRLGKFIRRQLSQAIVDASQNNYQLTPSQKDPQLDIMLATLQRIEEKLLTIHAVATDSRKMRTSCYLGNNRALTVTHRGDRMYVDTRDIAISTGLLCFGGWEDDTIVHLERFLKPGMVWADVGANCGYFTVIGHKLVKAGGQPGETYAFEISPDNFRLCVDNLVLSWMQDGSHVEQMAIYSTVGSLAFNVFTKYGVNSSTSNISDEFADYIGEKPRPITVPSTTLDAYFLSRPRLPQFVKIDIEGNELHALQGARDLIEAEPDIKLLIEWSPGQMVSCGNEPRALAELIPELGLKCFNAENNMAPLTIADCLAIERTTMLVLSHTAIEGTA